MENPTQPKSEGATPTRNNTGRTWIAVRDLAGDYLEVWNTDENGKRVKLIASCFVTPGEAYADAVAACLAELADPDTCFNSEEEEADTRDGIKWLADALAQEGRDA